MSLGPSGAPAFTLSIQSSETDVCRPLWCPQQHAPGPQGDTPRAHACLGGAQGSGPTGALQPRDGYVGEPGLPRWGICSREPLCTHAWALSTRTPRVLLLRPQRRLSSWTVVPAFIRDPWSPQPLPPHPRAVPASLAAVWTVPGCCHPGGSVGVPQASQRGVCRPEDLPFGSRLTINERYPQGHDGGPGALGVQHSTWAARAKPLLSDPRGQERLLGEQHR